MILVAVESPYAARGPYTVEQNVEFARRVCKYVIGLGHAPFAMHLLYPQVLDDQNTHERMLGINCGLAWADRADEAWFCLRPNEDLSPGMAIALEAYRQRGKAVRFARLSPAGELIELSST